MEKRTKIALVTLILLIVIVGGVFLIEHFNSNNKIKEKDNIISEMEDDTSRGETENNPTFFAKVIESNSNYILVEPFENEEIRKSSDKFYISLGENNDCLYVVGTNIKVTYTGLIRETYPAQIDAINIELKSTDSFEIIFNDKSPQTNVKYIPIISKGEISRYDYNVYSSGGLVNIVINGKTLSLRDALLNNKITMEEIIAKANKDFGDNAIMLKDGGTIEYHYSTYTLIKRHTIDGDRDVYFMSPKEK